MIATWSLAGSGTTATRWPVALARRATPGAPAMYEPSAPELSVACAESPTRPDAVNAVSCATAAPRRSAPLPGVRLVSMPAGSRPTDDTSTRPDAGSSATPCTPGVPLKCATASTRLSRQSSSYAAPGTATQITLAVGPNRTPATRPRNTV